MAFVYNNSYQTSIGMAPYEALYGRPCKSPSCWWKSTVKTILGPGIIRDTFEKVELIRRRIKAAQDRSKSYADKRRIELEFVVGDLVFVKLSPLKNVLRFGISRKLAPCFVGHFLGLEWIWNLSYRVELSEKMV